MECTQRLECTQELNETQSERTPDQIAFLGICGKKYPVKKGPNKVGRDPSTCNIVLNSVSISRQHAVINVLNKDNFMLMDLDSANKTKLSGRTLQPYIPQPLHNGDTIQLGDIFGMFRLLEEEDNLPMTQAIDIPDTPLSVKHISRINTVTTVPESPDVSDKDDSFIVPSQPISSQFRSPKTRNFIKPGKTISIQPMGSNKIDNIFWNSSRKSTSLNLDDSNTSHNNSIPVKSDENENKISSDIHELQIQMCPASASEEGKDSIYSADTQLPKSDNLPSIYTDNTQIPSTANLSIHCANTQLPSASQSPSIHTLDTQIPGDNLPEVCKINKQQDMQINLCANESIYNAETQLCPAGKENVPINSRNSPTSLNTNNVNLSNDEIIFDDIEQPFEGFESQAILTDDIELPINRYVESDESLSQIVKPKSAQRNMRLKSDETASEPQSQLIKPISAKRNMRIDSDGSTDCDDEDVPVHKISEKKIGDDDTTDCEEDIIELKNTTNKELQKAEIFEDMLTQVIVNNDVEFEDMLTQVIEVDVTKENAIAKKDNENTDVDFNDLPTQVLEEDLPPQKQRILTKQLTLTDKNSPFKIPFNSTLKTKKKEGSRTPKIKLKDTDNKYYHYTQDIYDDLCTQKLDSVETKSVTKVSINKDNDSKKLINTPVIHVDPEKKIEESLKNTPNQEVISVNDDNAVVLVKKVPSDGSSTSDVENTPKKRRPFCMDIDLPDSQEIKMSVSLSTRVVVTETSSESDTEQNSEDQNTPVVFRKKKNLKHDAKLDLTKKFDLEALPSRVITRVRKPTVKLQDQPNKKAIDILKPKFITEQEGEIDKDIITENLSRLKNTIDKPKNTKSNHSNSTEVEIIEMSVAENVKKGRSCRMKGEDTTLKLDTIINRAKDQIDDTKRRKREPRITKTELQDSKIQSSITKTNSNQSVSTIESKDKANLNKLKADTGESTKSPVETKRSTRARNAKTEKTKALPPVEKDKQTERPKRSTRKPLKPDPKKQEKKDPSPEKEIRRSKRQRPVKEVVKKETPKSILKKTAPEESLVYNISSGSNSDCNRSKRFLEDSEGPSAKRSRSSNNNMRITPSRTLDTQYVLFTAFPHEEVKVKLVSIGAVVVTDVTQSTVLLTKQIKRTFKLLCAVGLGQPIVGPAWVQACVDAHAILDPWQYLIKDDHAEQRFHFSLERTLKGQRNFLRGYNVSSTPGALPAKHEMKLIVECSGGSWAEGGPRWVCVSVPGDAALWPALRRRGATIVSTEFILGGVLRQRLDIQLNILK